MGFLSGFVEHGGFISPFEGGSVGLGEGREGIDVELKFAEIDLFNRDHGREFVPLLVAEVIDFVELRGEHLLDEGFEDGYESALS